MSDDRPDTTRVCTQQDVLHARAQALARESEQAQIVEPRLEVVEFLLAYENYAIETAYIREVCPVHDLTPVPCTPSVVCGIINLRGQILAVLDIKQLFDLPEKGLIDRHHVIVLHAEQKEVGILVDAIRGVRVVRQSELQSSLPTLTGRCAEYLRGVTSERLIVLDALRVLSDQRLVVNEEVTP